MKMKNRKKNREKNGVALIIVLGLLSVLTLLAVAFAIAMRVERLAARNYADLVRSKHLIRVAMIRAIDDINGSVAGACYPDWGAIASQGGGAPMLSTMNLLSEEATNVVPRAQWNAAVSLAPKWINIIDPSGRTNGRVGYIAVNSSGLLDANYVGGPDVWGGMGVGWLLARSNSTSVKGLDLSGLPEITSEALGIQSPSAGTFYYDRPQIHRRYETIAEFETLNPGLFNGPVSNFFVYSYDLNRDEYFEDPNQLGQRYAVLSNKFNINSITNFWAYTDGSETDPFRYSGNSPFMTGYFNPLRDLIRDTGLTHKPDDIAWNLINWLDTDRIPQTGDANPSVGTEGGEALPLINEIELKSDTFTVELWFPFAGGPDIKVDPGEFTLEIDTGSGWQSYGIGAMSWEDNQFRTFPHAAAGSTQIMARVMYGVTAVDAAMDRDDAKNVDFTPFTGDYAMSVDDPRSNGKPAYWSVQPATLGARNANCQPWMAERQGLPIYAKDGLMDKIGELGYISLGNRENCDGGAYCVGQKGLDCTPSTTSHPGQDYWTTINLYKGNEGVYMLDHLTTRDPGAPPETRGLVSINSKQEDVLFTLFKGMKIGPPLDKHVVPDSAIRDLVAVIIAENPAISYISFQDMFDDTWNGGTVGQAFRACAEATVPGGQENDKHYEDLLRNITEMITFRQNVFTVLLGAQTLAEDGETILSEKRAVATVYRDSYTGQTMMRSFKWLSDR